jgi:hypothetical protein
VIAVLEHPPEDTVARNFRTDGDHAQQPHDEVAAFFPEA